jgi:hypothetical protein
VLIEPRLHGVSDDAADGLAGTAGVVLESLPFSPEAQAERLLTVPVRHGRRLEELETMLTHALAKGEVGTVQGVETVGAVDIPLIVGDVAARVLAESVPHDSAVWRVNGWSHVVLLL